LSSFTGASSEFVAQCLTLQWCDQTLCLHAQKVLYWQEQKTLLAADVHVGKEHAFGRAGIGVPGGISEATLQSLMTLVDDCGAERLLILGDLLHAMPTRDESWQSTLSAQLHKRSQLDMTVVAGNHDKPAARERVDSRINWAVESIHEAPFVFQHEPDTDARGYVLCGHIHPVWRLGTRREKLRAPVFWFQRRLAVLPAFGHFTGGHNIQRTSGERLFMTGPDCVVEV
jgi:DNA ligase-associated metallophosphoesterase